MTEPILPETNGAQRLNAAQWRRILDETPLFFEVTSNSMAPTFRAGDQVWIRPIQDGEPQPGQVLAYFCGRLVTHRYLGDGVCLGDNASLKDPPISRDAMVGIATQVKRRGKVVPLGTRSPLRTKIHRLLRLARRVARKLRRPRPE